MKVEIKFTFIFIFVNFRINIKIIYVLKQYQYFQRQENNIISSFLLFFIQIFLISNKFLLFMLSNSKREYHKFKLKQKRFPEIKIIKGEIE